jgi:hypothetical protein
MGKTVLAAGVIHPPFFPEEHVRVQETHFVLNDVRDQKNKGVVEVSLRRIPISKDD